MVLRLIEQATKRGTHRAVIFCSSSISNGATPLIHWGPGTCRTALTTHVSGIDITRGSGPDPTPINHDVYLCVAFAQGGRADFYSALKLPKLRIDLHKIHVIHHLAGSGPEGWSGGIHRAAITMPANAQDWLAAVESAWLECAWLVDSNSDASFRQAHWAATHSDLYGVNPSVPTQTYHSIPANTPINAINTPLLSYLLDLVPRRATVRGGIPCALLEIMRRKVGGRACLIDKPVLNMVKEIWVAISDLWSSTTTEIVNMEKGSGLRAEVMRAIGSYQHPKVKRVLGVRHGAPNKKSRKQ